MYKIALKSDVVYVIKGMMIRRLFHSEIVLGNKRISMWNYASINTRWW